ncbi:hypothetical protein ACLB2K_006877 [Fragaria x ananassa]
MAMEWNGFVLLLRHQCKYQASGNIFRILMSQERSKSMPAGKPTILFFPLQAKNLLLVRITRILTGWRCHSRLPKENFDKLLWGIWSIWRKTAEFGVVASQVGIHKGLFAAANAKKLKQPSLRSSQWKLPSIGWLKANIDGAFIVDSHCGGIGVVFRDSSQFVGGCYVRVNFLHNSSTVEGLATRLASHFAAQHNMAPVVFESDCLKVVNDVKGAVTDLSGNGTLICDIQSLLALCGGSRISHVYREANIMAHKVARLPC